MWLFEIAVTLSVVVVASQASYEKEDRHRRSYTVNPGKVRNRLAPELIKSKYYIFNSVDVLVTVVIFISSFLPVVKRLLQSTKPNIKSAQRTAQKPD